LNYFCLLQYQLTAYTAAVPSSKENEAPTE
jgi:hypothetical protein